MRTETSVICFFFPKIANVASIFVFVVVVVDLFHRVLQAHPVFMAAQKLGREQQNGIRGKGKEEKRKIS